MIRISKPAPLFENVVAYKKGANDFVKISLADYRGKWLVFFSILAILPSSVQQN